MDQVLGEHGGSPLTHAEFQHLLHGLDAAASERSLPTAPAATRFATAAGKGTAGAAPALHGQ